MATAKTIAPTTVSGEAEVPSPKAASERKSKATRKVAFGRAGEQASEACRMGAEWLFTNELPIICSATHPDGSERPEGAIPYYFPPSFDVYFGTVTGGASERVRGGAQVIEGTSEAYDTGGYGKLFIQWNTDGWAKFALHCLAALDRICVPKDEKPINWQQIFMERAGYRSPMSGKTGKPTKLSAANYAADRSIAAMQRAQALGGLLEKAFGEWPKRAAVKGKRSGTRNATGKATHWVIRCGVTTCAAHKRPMQFPKTVWEGMEAVTGKRGGPQNIVKFCAHSRADYEVVKAEGFPTPEEPFPLPEYQKTVATMAAKIAADGKKAVNRATEEIATKQA